MTSIPEQNQQSGGMGFAIHLRDYGMMIALIAIIGFFAVATHGALLSPLNVTNIILQNSYVIIMALGMMMIIVAGHIDLSVGSVVGFIGALAAVLIVQADVPAPIAALLCLLVGAIIGAGQGYLVAYHKMPAFIVTLGGMLIFRGLSLWLLDGRSIGPFPVAFQKISSGFIPDIFSVAGFHLTTMLIGAAVAGLSVYAGWRERANNQRHGVDLEPAAVYWVKNAILVGVVLYASYLLASYRGLPNVAMLMFGLIVLFAFVTTRTTFGRRIYALGGNEKAAKLSGINTERLVFFTFAIMGSLAALAGLVVAARLNTATPKAGVSFELDVIAACFIGGASASGGVGKVTGAVIGAFVMGVMNNGMSILGIGIDWQQVIKGTVLLIAVFFDVYNKKKA
ncbi:MAG: multiple monosaccharide ABC transporter permease [Methylocella sp.]